MIFLDIFGATLIDSRCYSLENNSLTKLFLSRNQIRALSKSCAIHCTIAGRIEVLIFMVGSTSLPKRNLA
ncbi:MAG: hypothetical protein ABF379_12685, partial [Akkermansiaceae bacterium]